MKEKFFESPVKFNQYHMLPTDMPEDQTHIATTFQTARKAATAKRNSAFKLIYSLKKQHSGCPSFPVKGFGEGKICRDFLSGKCNSFFG